MNDLATIRANAFSQASHIAFGLKQKKALRGLGLAVALIVLAGGGYMLLNSANSGAKIEEQATTTQPLFLAYARTMEKLSEHIVETSGSDSDSLERYSLEGKLLLEEAEAQKVALEEQLALISASDLSEYKSSIEQYIEKADVLFKVEGENVAVGEYYVEPIRNYEKIQVTASGAGNYMYSDPDKYVSIINNVIADEKAVIAELKQMGSLEVLNELHALMITSMEAEVAFLGQLSRAVANRNADSISLSLQGFVQGSQDRAKEMGLIQDTLDKMVEDTNDELDVLKESVETEYNTVRAAHAF